MLRQVVRMVGGRCTGVLRGETEHEEQAARKAKSAPFSSSDDPRAAMQHRLHWPRLRMCGSPWPPRPESFSFYDGCVALS